MKKITVFLLLFLVSFADLMAIKIIYVTPNGSTSESVDGLSWGNAVSLSRGRSLANYYNTKTVPEENQIWMKGGTYDLTAAFQTNIKITIYGGFSGNETSLSERNWPANQTIINQTAAAMVIWGNTQDDVLLDGLILQGGRPSSGTYGCGQIAQGTTLRNCIIRNNKVTGNVGALGFFAVSGSTKRVILDNCLIINNEASGNTSAIAAGAVPADIINCTIANNLALTGTIAAISNSGSVNIYNSIFYNNKNNSSSAKSIGDNANKVVGNCAWDVAATNGTLTNNLLISSSPFVSATSYVGAANGTSQLASTIESANFQIASGSSCINAGNDSYTTATTDLNGVTRKNSTVDIGCYEYGFPGAPTATTATAGNAKVVVGFSAPSANGGSAIIDYTITAIPGGISTTSSSSPVVLSGLTNGTAYTFSVKANNANGAGIAAQTTSVTPHATNNIISVSGSGNISSQSLTAVSDVVVDNGAELNINATTSINSITVAPGSKLTLSENQTLTLNSLVLQSNSSGTATLVDNNTTSAQALSATVEQYFGAARNWYATPPVAGVTVPAGHTYYTYDETGSNTGFVAPATAYWVAVTEGSVINPMKGYVLQIPVPTTLSLSGVLNTGEMQLALTRQGVLKTGYNLVANPYPSYLDWSMVDTTAAKITSTIWYRTKTALNAYTFDTYNGKLDEATMNGTNVITKLIPPMQAFWVRVKAGETNATLTFTNVMRKHIDNSNNLFKVPVKNESMKQIIRMKVSNGSNSDETLICTHPGASNFFDSFDSEKMSNSSGVIPEIYTKAGSEQLAINGLNSFSENMELMLGFTTGQAGDFTIKTSEFTNIGNDYKVYLRDKIANIETEINDDSEYQFHSEITTNNESRFSLIFKSGQAITNLQPENQANYSVFQNTNGQIVIIAPAGSEYIIRNAHGGLVCRDVAADSTTLDKIKLASGVYLVTIISEETKITQKIIVE